MSHSGKRLNDAWLGLLVSVPQNRGKGRGRDGGRERERRNEQLGSKMSLPCMGIRQIQAPELSFSAVLLTPATRLGGRATEANAKQRLWCEYFGQRDSDKSGSQQGQWVTDKARTQGMIYHTSSSCNGQRVWHDYLKAWRT